MSKFFIVKLKEEFNIAPPTNSSTKFSKEQVMYLTHVSKFADTSTKAMKYIELLKPINEANAPNEAEKTAKSMAESARRIEESVSRAISVPREAPSSASTETQRRKWEESICTINQQMTNFFMLKKTIKHTFNTWVKDPLQI